MGSCNHNKRKINQTHHASVVWPVAKDRVLAFGTVEQFGTVFSINNQLLQAPRVQHYASGEANGDIKICFYLERL